MPDDERNLADTAHDLGVALTSLPAPILFRRGRVPVYPDWITDTDGNSLPALVPLTPAACRTFFDPSDARPIGIQFCKTKFDQRTNLEREVTCTLSKSEAEGFLESRQLLEWLPEITAIHPRPLPIFNTDGTLRLLPVGYDTDTGIYTYG
jgi:hypothetical protein